MTPLEQRTVELAVGRVLQLGEQMADNLNRAYQALNEARALLDTLRSAMGAKDAR